MAVACTHQPLGVGVRPENLDTTVAPNQDFYAFACGGWMKNNPLPDEYSRFGSFDQLALNNMEQVNGLITDLAAETNEHGSVAQKIGDLYNLCMDTARRNQEGVQPVLPTISEVHAISDRSQLSAALGGAMEYGLWALYVEADAMNSSMNILNEAQAGYALGERDYYLDNDDHSRMIRKEYLKHIERMFTLFGYTDGADRAKTILRMETRLAKAALSNVELRDPQKNYNKMSIADLQALVPQVDWQVYMQAMGIATDSISVGQVAHLQEAGKMLADEDLEDLKTLFLWQVIDGAADYLTDEIFMQNFHFYGEIMSGSKEPRQLWKRAVGIVNGSLGEAVGQMYVKKYFPEENKQRMLRLVRNLQTTLGERIQAVDWMSDTTKAKALEKLQALPLRLVIPILGATIRLWILTPR